MNKVNIEIKIKKEEGEKLEVDFTKQDINVSITSKTPFNFKISTLAQKVISVIIPTISGGDMKRALYDKNFNGIVDMAEGLSDGVNYISAQEVIEHVGNREIHRRIWVDEKLMLIEVN